MEITQRVERFWRAFMDSDAQGPAALAGLVTPDVKFRGTLGIAAVGEVVGQGDVAAARLTFSGQHQAELFGVPPTGRRMEYDGMAWMRMEGDRFAEFWVMGDAAEWMSTFRELQQ